jgi:hypothetical protein
MPAPITTALAFFGNPVTRKSPFYKKWGFSKQSFYYITDILEAIS